MDMRGQLAVNHGYFEKGLEGVTTMMLGMGSESLRGVWVGFHGSYGQGRGFMGPAAWTGSVFEALKVEFD